MLRSRQGRRPPSRGRENRYTLSFKSPGPWGRSEQDRVVEGIRTWRSGQVRAPREADRGPWCPLAQERDLSSSPPQRNAEFHRLPLDTQALSLPRLPGLTPHVAGTVTNATIRGWGQNACVRGARGDAPQHSALVPLASGRNSKL